MDYHQNARLTIHSREQLARLVLDQGSTLKAAAVALKVSAKTAAKWVRRCREIGSAGLKDLSSRPHRSPRQTSPLLLERVLVLRRQRWNGWRVARPQVQARPGHHQPYFASLGTEPPAFARPSFACDSLRAQASGDLVHFDIKRLARIRRPGRRVTGDCRKESRGIRWGYLHVAIDDHSLLLWRALLGE